MDERYWASEQQANDIVEALASDDINVLQENKVKDIHCLLSTLSKSVTSALGEVKLHLHVIGQRLLMKYQFCKVSLTYKMWRGR